MVRQTVLCTLYNVKRPSLPSAPSQGQVAKNSDCETAWVSGPKTLYYTVGYGVLDSNLCVTWPLTSKRKLQNATLFYWSWYVSVFQGPELLFPGGRFQGPKRSRILVFWLVVVTISLIIAFPTFFEYEGTSERWFTGGNTINRNVLAYRTQTKTGINERH